MAKQSTKAAAKAPEKEKAIPAAAPAGGAETGPEALETAVPAADVLPPQDMDGAARKEAPDEDAVPGEAAIPGAQAAQEGRRAVVCSPKGLNLRAGPALSYAALEVLPDGMEVLALDLPRGAAVPGWELVDAGGRTGWASTRFLRPLEG